jgi:NAD(P)-dependent dehydrogenase (short-subunit alcohol dehydrogenase family)
MMEESVAEKAALITGGSSGIGLAIARALGEDGYGLTVSARRPEKLEAAVEGLRSDGLEVESVAANMGDNAGVGIGESMDSLTTKYVDMQLGVNLRAVILMTRECLPMLQEAGAEHGKALLVNTASISGKAGQPWLSVYSATKAAVIGFSQATQKEIAGKGVQVTAFAPAFVDTPMTEFAKQQVSAEAMIRPEDIAEAVRFLLRTSPNCLVPEIMFLRPGDTIDTPDLG